MHCTKIPGTNQDGGKPKRSADKPGIRLRRRWCGGVEKGLVLFMTGMLAVTLGCSGGEDQPPQGKNKVVIAIKKAAVPPAKPLKPARSAVAPEKAASSQRESTEQQGAQPSKHAEAQHHEKPGGPGLEKGFVRVRKGESLSAVAARADVYGNALGWPNLYRLNIEHLSMLHTWQDIKRQALPAGVVLRYVPAAEGVTQSPFQPKPWVVTVRSWQTPGKLAGPAIKLLQNGYHAYITRAVVKGKRWLRLRVGFYRSKSEALVAKEKIGEILGSNDAWIARAGKTELKEFGGD